MKNSIDAEPQLASVSSLNAGAPAPQLYSMIRGEDPPKSLKVYWASEKAELSRMMASGHGSTNRI